MNKLWSDRAWEEYLYWQMQDKKTLKKINELVKDKNNQEEINMRIGIIGAMSEEVQGLKKLLENIDEEKIGNLTFYTGVMHDKDIVLLETGIGKVYHIFNFGSLNFIFFVFLYSHISDFYDII